MNLYFVDNSTSPIDYKNSTLFSIVLLHFFSE